MESELKNVKGIDETAIFRLLWRKRIFIFVATLLFVIIGFAYTYFRPPVYNVGLELKFEKGDHSYIQGLLGYGKIDFACYAQTGQFGDSCCLYMNSEEQELLKYYKDKVIFEINYPDTRISITGMTTDTVEFGGKLIDFGKVLQKEMTRLGESYAQIETDSLNLEIDRIQQKLKKRLEKLMEFQDEHRSSSDLQTKIRVKLAEYEYESFAIFEFRKIDELKLKEEVFADVRVRLSSPEVLSNNTPKNIFFIFSRWTFFGFIVSCVWVVGGSLIQSLLSKRKG